MENQTEIAQLRQVMEQFINQRLQAKQKKTTDEAKRQQLIQSHQPSVWLADAARRVRQSQLVTHALKYTHPEARGTSLYSRGNPAAGERLIGTHSLDGRVKPDVVGNAASQDVIKFLSLEVNGKSLWQRALDNDPNLLAALPGDEAEKRAWMDAFASLVQPKGKADSHRLAKQLYWPLAEGGYHLLQPLFPTSLVQRVWETLRQDFQNAQAARQARRSGEPYPNGYRDWRDLAIQKFGSGNPQNISQFNIKRHGEVWLLPSTPPIWSSPNHKVRLPLKVASVFEHFGRLRSVREQFDELGRFLLGVRDWNNLSIRRGRARRVEQIIDELIRYVSDIQQQPPGWSADPDCRLPEVQRLWLDPYRDDVEFVAKRRTIDWPRSVAESFGAWFNERLRHRLPVGEAEYRAWRQELEERLHTLLREMAV